ncbi:MAG: hypothetical protein H7Z71_11115 [Moraxellaceae bacterium]|nr:hypothetical protein [Pseudobdellovibrionaceae bacterium]
MMSKNESNLTNYRFFGMNRLISLFISDGFSNMIWCSPFIEIISSSGHNPTSMKNINSFIENTST